MRQKCGRGKRLAEKVVKDIRRATWRQVSSEEKIRIVLAGLRGEDSIAKLCRREGSPRACISAVQGFPGGGQEALRVRSRGYAARPVI